jgi:manganese-dependent inorganic pyrophosphatase
MMGGIISDTLNLTSPTTTDIDREILPWLEKIARCDANQLADEFFSTGSVLQGHDATDSVRVDCKEFEQNGWKIAVSQVEEQGLDYFWQQKDKLRQAMLKLSQERSLDFACFLVTDVTAHYSVMLTVGNPRVIEAIDYPALEENLFALDGVVSRKKQLMPRLSWILDKVPKHEQS